MILSFGDADTQRLYLEERPKKLPPEILKRGLRKLMLIDAAVTINDLRSPPGNRLEKLSGDYDGYHSVRVNDQWRIVFNWTKDGAEDVSIVDYH